MALPSAMSSPVTWWQGTALDLSYLGAENLARLASLASTPTAFYLKYVQTKNTQGLKKDVQEALSTTEEYAQDFASRVSLYFEEHWLPQQRTSPTPQPESSSLPPPIQHNISSTPPSPQPPAMPVTQTPPQDQKSDPGMPREEIIQTIDRVKRDCVDYATSKATEQKDFAIAEITGLRAEMTQIVDTQRRLADSFNQMRQFLEDFIKSQHTQPPVLATQPMVPASAIGVGGGGVYGYPGSFPSQSQASPSAVPPSTLAGGMRGFGAPPLSTGPASAVPAVQSYYPSTASPSALTGGGGGGGASPSSLPAPPSGAGGLGNYGASAYGLDFSEYGGGGGGGGGAWSGAGPMDLMSNTKFEVRDPSVVKVMGKSVTWVNRKETTLLLDYVVLEDVVAVSWRTYLGQAGGIFAETFVKFGFIMDVLGTGCTEEEAQKIFVDYKSNGKLHIRSHTEKVEPFGTGDLIKIELNMKDRTAIIFKNDVPLPVKITMIPKVNKFYICGCGMNTRVELVSLSSKLTPTTIPQTPGWKEIAMDKV